MLQIFSETIQLQLISLSKHSHMPAVQGICIHAIFIIRPDSMFSYFSIFLFGLNDDIIDVRFRSQSGINHIVNDMHYFFNGYTQYFTAQISIFIELEIHSLFDVVTRYFSEAFLSKLSMATMGQVFLNTENIVKTSIQYFVIYAEFLQLQRQSNLSDL